MTRLVINMRDATLPLTYEDSLQEIARLKSKLAATQEKWAKSVVQRIADNRSHSRKAKATKELEQAVIMFVDTPSDVFTQEVLDRLVRARWAIE